MRRWVFSLLGFLIFWIGASPQSEAFHQVKSFTESANIGGAGGSFFTGSKRSKGYECSICHVGAEGLISIEMSSQLTAGSYRAGLIYPITIKLIGEHRGLESAFNPNTFTATILDDEGLQIGKFAVAGDPVMRTAQNRSVAIAEGMGNGESEWSFDWWAPDEARPATLHIAMLDGDGASMPDNRFIDPLNDDVATYRLRLCPADQVCDPPQDPASERSPAGCSSAADAGSLLGALLVLLVFAALRLRSPLSSQPFVFAALCLRSPLSSQPFVEIGNCQ